MTDTGEANLGEILVIGIRAVPGAPRAGSGGGGQTGVPDQNEVSPDPTTAPDGYYTEEQAREENERQRECAAQQTKEEYESLPENQRNDAENFAYSWIKDGELVSHPIRPGTGAVVTVSDRAQARSDYGIDRSSVVGFTHNHPANVYCSERGIQGIEQRRLNGYPSENDWAQADLDVEQFGAPSDEFTLFIIDCEGTLRAFPYSQKEAFKAARARGTAPPQPIAPVCEPE